MSNTAYRTASRTALAIGAAMIAATASLHAQDAQDDKVMATVYGQQQPTPSVEEMTEGPEVKGIISARRGNQIYVTAADGSRSAVNLMETTKISASKGLFGIAKDKLTAASLVNGLPVEIKTLQAGDQLYAAQVSTANKDMKTANMIHAGTNQRFEAQEAATEALRSRVGDIDKYNIKHTANVYFDTGKHVLSNDAKQTLCATASTAESTDNALLLVVGYTDSVGDEDYNQELSERRASRVVNYLQQACGWKPYRMITPTGMAMADPAASNDTAEGRAQNRRVSVNVLVSKSVDGI
jgi:outer membrane protein OmpA-like peptidoglycan-associated protein